MAAMRTFRKKLKSREAEKGNPKPTAKLEELGLAVLNIQDYAIALIDLDGKIANWNDGAAKITQYTRAEITSKHYSVFLSQASIETMNPDPVLEQARTTGRYAFEGPQTRKDGSNYVAHIVITPHLKNDKLRGFLAVFWDDTERRKTEQSIHDQAELLNLTQDSVLVRKLSGEIFYWNKGAEDMYGFTKEEAIGKSPHELLKSSFESTALQEIDLQLLVVKRWQGEIHYKRKDGTPLVINNLWTLKTDEYGQPAAVLEIHRDVTERSKAYEELKKQKNFYEAVLNSLSDAVLVADTAGEFMLVNKAQREMVGARFDPTIPVGERARAFGLYLPDMKTYFSAEDLPLIRALNGEYVKDVEMYLRNDHVPDGKWLEASGGPVTSPTSDIETCGVIVIRDITERKRAEQQLREMSEKLNASNAELQQFAFAAAHDLQEPLRTVSGFLELMQKRNKDNLDEESTRYIAIVLSTVLRMKTLIKDLLSYSRIETMARPLTLVPADKALGSAINALRHSIRESGAQIIKDKLPSVLADPTQLEQLFQNLLGNSIKYRDVDPPLIRVNARRSESECIFSIEDNGIGFDMEHAERVFAVFKRLHPVDKYPGTGIGLALCKRIVQRHGGRIWVHSEKGKGSTFYFTLPATNAQEP
jgi:PAS domain S-box-containing protein